MAYARAETPWLIPYGVSDANDRTLQKALTTQATKSGFEVKQIKTSEKNIKRPFVVVFFDRKNSRLNESLLKAFANNKGGSDDTEPTIRYIFLLSKEDYAIYNEARNKMQGSSSGDYLDNLLVFLPYPTSTEVFVETMSYIMEKVWREFVNESHKNEVAYEENWDAQKEIADQKTRGAVMDETPLAVAQRIMEFASCESFDITPFPLPAVRVFMGSQVALAASYDDALGFLCRRLNLSVRDVKFALEDPELRSEMCMKFALFCLQNPQSISQTLKTAVMLLFAASA